MLYIYNLQKQSKDQIIGILEEIDSFYWPKMHLWKGDNNLGRALPPSLDKIQKDSNFFFVKPSLTSYPIHHCSHSVKLLKQCKHWEHFMCDGIFCSKGGEQSVEAWRGAAEQKQS